MRLLFLQYLFTFVALVTAAALQAETTNLAKRSDLHQLEKRRGGGGRGGGSSGGGSRGGRSGGGRSSSSSSGASSRTSVSGGRTTFGSGTKKLYGGAYGGGASTPYNAGSRSTTTRILPAFLGGAAVATVVGTGLVVAGGIYTYPFSDKHNFYNREQNRNETLPILCFCHENRVCGCDENHQPAYTQAIYENALGAPNGTEAFQSKIADVNGTRTLIINGTLDNGTTSAGTPSGSVVSIGRNWSLLLIAGVVMLFHISM